MPSRQKKSVAVPFNAVDVGTIAKANPYVQRLMQDAKLRQNVRSAFDSSRSAYGRLSNGKAPARTLLEDKKLQRDLRKAFEAAREASMSLQEAQKKGAGKGLRLGRKLLLVGVAGGLALASSEKLRSKVLDTLFGAEEEFEYTPPANSASGQPTSSVGAA